MSDINQTNGKLLAKIKEMKKEKRALRHPKPAKPEVQKDIEFDDINTFIDGILNF